MCSLANEHDKKLSIRRRYEAVLHGLEAVFKNVKVRGAVSLSTNERKIDEYMYIFFPFINTTRLKTIKSFFFF